MIDCRWPLLIAALAIALPAQGDSPGTPGRIPVPPVQIDGEDSPAERPLLLWDRADAALQVELEAAIERLQLTSEVGRHHLAVVLVDITDVENSRVASVNGDLMLYAASLPKIAVLLAAFEQIASGDLELDAELRSLLDQMIRQSSNPATTEVMHRVGKENISRILRSSRYGLYDPNHNGGLWVGKDFAKAGLWKRDPIHNLSHGATAMQVARFYYLLETEQLVSPEHSRLMKDILGSDHIQHKFISSLAQIDPEAQILRKSGSWRRYHADSVLVRRRGRAYIAVALSEDEDGKIWLQKLIYELDAIIMARHPEPESPSRN